MTDPRVTQFAVAEAKAKFSELLARAEKGEEIVIKRHGQPVAKLSGIANPEDERERKRRAIDEFIAWRNANIPVSKEQIDYKALIEEGRRF